jgi:hypothetical protein
MARHGIFIAALFLSACAYSFQSSRNPLAEREGIRRIYIASVVNNSYKPGVENLIYNTVQRALSMHRRVVLVDRPEEADGLLQGTVNNASATVNAITSAAALDPPGVGPDAGVASEYLATLDCSFTLLRQKSVPGKNDVVWTGGFTKARPFPGNNRVGVLGTTSALINESEFERMLQEIALRMAEDVHESMLAQF